MSLAATLCSWPHGKGEGWWAAGPTPNEALPPWPPEWANMFWNPKKVVQRSYSGWWFQLFFFYPYLGKWSNLTNIFQMGWNHQLLFYGDMIIFAFWGWCFFFQVFSNIASDNMVWWKVGMVWHVEPPTWRIIPLIKWLVTPIYKPA